MYYVYYQLPDLIICVFNPCQILVIMRLIFLKIPNDCLSVPSKSAFFYVKHSSRRMGYPLVDLRCYLVPFIYMFRHRMIHSSYVVIVYYFIIRKAYCSPELGPTAINSL